VAVGAEQNKVCTNCGCSNLREQVPINRMGISYLSGIIVKTKPLTADLCMECGHINLHIEDPAILEDKEVVQNPTKNFLPIVLFALFILSLQLDS
jgi:hypothetical protein